MKLSEHFSLEEFTRSQTASRLGIDNTPNQTVIMNLKELANKMEEIREIFEAPVSISSGFRCPELNRKIGGAINSQHIKGQACDFRIGDLPLDNIIELIITSNVEFDQLIKEYDDGKGGGWVHISVSEKPRKQALIIDRDGTRTYA